MKKLMFALFGVAVFCGCDDTQPQEHLNTVRVADNFGAGLHKEMIEGHDYIVYHRGYAGGICHSASCPCTKKNTEEK